MAVFVLTGAANRGSSRIEVGLCELQPSVFVQTIERKGLIEPLHSTEVRSNCYWTTTILSIVPEGTWVQKGDVVCVLDSSEVEEFARAREVYLIRYRGRLDNALHEEEMLQTQNERRLEAARFNFESAARDYAEHTEGTFPKLVEEMEHKLAMLNEQTRAAEDKVRHVEQLWSMGMVNQREMQAEAFKLLDVDLKQERLESQFKALTQFTNPRTEVRLEYRRNEAERNLARTQVSNSLAATKARLTTLAYERTLGIYERHHRRAVESASACTLKAPCDGQVLYGNSWYLQSRGIRQIQEGATVRLSQKIFEIPDPGRTKVSVPLEESLIYKVRVGMPVKVRLPGNDDLEVNGSIASISRYPRMRSSYTPHLKDYWLDVELLPTEEQRALLTLKADVVATLTLDERPDTLQIPRDTITGVAGHNFVYVFDGKELVSRKVVLGDANEESVCVVSGIQPGEKLVTTMTPQHRESLRKTLVEDLGRQESSF